MISVTVQTGHVYGECGSAARSWSRKGRVVIKAEVVRHPGRAPKDNPRFWANQFRVLLTAAAYALMPELRPRAARTACARARVTAPREHLIKLGARVLVSAHDPDTQLCGRLRS